MPDDINFIDLAALTRVTPDAVVEKFGGVINSSFFDASNILASLKQKGLIDFTTAFPGQSAITITDLGKQLLNEAHDKANTPFDQLDLTVLTQLSAGKRSIQDLSQSVNVTQKDLALRVFKLAQNGYLSYDIRNGSVSMALTEKGFLQVKSGMPQGAAAMPMEQQAMMQQGFQPNPQAQPQPQPQQAQAAQTAQTYSEAQPSMAATIPGAAAGDNLAEIQERIRMKRRLRLRYAIAVLAIVAIILAVVVLMRLGGRI